MRRGETAEEIDDAAFAWVARLDRLDLTSDLQAELEQWLAVDTRRQGAFLRAQAIWQSLDRASRIDAQPEIDDVAGRVSPGPERELRRPARRAWIGGGGALIAACAAGLVWQANEGGAISTARGEVRHVPLPDGSTMLLNTQSRVRVAMRPHERRLKMSSGEAWFQVQRDPARPFIVEVGSVRVRAVGTAFSVRQRDLGVEILVTEGVVEAWLVGREANRIRLSAGQKAMVAETSPIKQLDTAPSELDRRLAWRSGRIDLAGETLAEAVEEFNRYNARQIYVAQPELNSRKLYGIFRVDDPDGFSRAIHYSLNAQISTSNSLIIIGG